MAFGCRTAVSIIVCGIATLASIAVQADETPDHRWSAAQRTADEIDRRLAEHWQKLGLEPAAAADRATLLRRTVLDLTGRVPTLAEFDESRADTSSDAYRRTIERLIEGPEFPLHFARVLDQWVQQRFADDEAFVTWLRGSLAERRSWDAMFRCLLVGPWEQEGDKAASRFLSKRVKSLDSMTADVTQAFFGVDITCARCHDHPLVSDWTQDHYYGMASFFGRTMEVKKNAGQIGEKPDGEVTFEARAGGQRTAAMMFLSGDKAASEPKQNRRERLVETALTERAMFSRAAVNRVWAWFFGRGLVEPVDQMHSANPPSVPGLLEWLADDFAAGGYDLHQLAAVVTLSRAYQLSSRWDRSGSPPPEDSFAAARLRPLTRHQLALSALLVVDAASCRVSAFDARQDVASAKSWYLELEKQTTGVLNGLDPASNRYQASTAEALFLANHPEVQKLVASANENLAARIGSCENHADRVRLAYRTLLSREPSESEIDNLAAWWREQSGVESAASQLVWALLTSAEFRFNH